MTQAELDALPDATGGWGTKEEIRDGQRIRIPVFDPGPCPGVLYPVADDEPCAVVDAHGERWMLGRGADGVLYKRRSLGL